MFFSLTGALIVPPTRSAGSFASSLTWLGGGGGGGGGIAPGRGLVRGAGGGGGGAERRPLAGAGGGGGGGGGGVPNGTFTSNAIGASAGGVYNHWCAERDAAANMA